MPYSEPKINKSNPKTWFIYFHHDVPYQLWGKYKRKRIRFRKYDNINRYTGEEREKYAEMRRQVWKYALDVLKYNPFEEQLKYQRALNADVTEVKEEIKALKNPSEEDARKKVSINSALENFMKSRRERKLAPASISAYQSSVDWILDGFAHHNLLNLKIGEVKFIHLSKALNFIAEEREWSATTINKEIDFVNSIFNWLATYDYIVKNPAKDKFAKLPIQKSKHTWYDRELAKKVKQSVLDAGKLSAYRAMQFTYWILIRSKKELQMLKVGDIDTDLKRIRFSADLSKNSREAYRDYPAEFEKILKEMELEKYPKDYYIFGKNNGMPGPYPVGHNHFSSQFKSVKDDLGLSDDYTIYGWKHTRIVHELMKGTPGEQISHMARHHSFKQTQDYLRDYDITLKNIYKPEDLTF